MSILTNSDQQQQQPEGIKVKVNRAIDRQNEKHSHNKSLPLPELTTEAQLAKLTDITGITPYITTWFEGIGYATDKLNEAKQKNQSQPLYWIPNEFDRMSGTFRTGRREGQLANRAEDDDISAIRFIFADFDRHIGGRGATPSDPVTVDEVMPLFPIGCEPTFIINTGKGVQAFWQLEPKVSVSEFSKEQYSAFHSYLINRFKSDKLVKNVSRLMRLPGSKYRKEETRGTDDYDKLMSFGYISGKKYTLADLIDAFEYEPASPAAKPEQADNTGKVIAHPDIVCSLIKAGKEIILNAAREDGHSQYTGAVVAVIKALRFYKASPDQLDEAKQKLIAARVQRKGEGFRSKAESDYSDMFDKAMSREPELEPYLAHVSGINPLKPAGKGRSHSQVVEELWHIVKDLTSFDTVKNTYRYNGSEYSEMTLMAHQIALDFPAFMPTDSNKTVLEAKIKQENTVNSIQEFAFSVKPKRDDEAMSLFVNAFGFFDSLEDPAAFNDFDRVYQYLEKFWTGAFARWMQPGLQHDEALVLLSDQGAEKTRFLRHFVPLNGTLAEDIPNIAKMEKDDFFLLSGASVAVNDEITTVFRKADQESVKRVLTKISYTGRRPYAKTTETIQFQHSWCLLGNDSEILNDATGSRRFLIVSFFGKSIDLNLIMSIKDRLYGHFRFLADEYFAGRYRYWFNKEETAKLNEFNRQFAYKSSLDDAIESWISNSPIEPSTVLASPVGAPQERISPFDFFTMEMLIGSLLSVTQHSTDLNKDRNKLSKALTGAGFKQTAKRRIGLFNTKFWYLPKEDYQPQTQGILKHHQA